MVVLIVGPRYVASQQWTIAPDSLSPAAAPATGFTLNRLGPFSLIEHIINDWFELIHPVAPILHRASFLKRLLAGDADRNAEFNDLVLSTCLATIVSLRRKSSINYGTVTAEQCLSLIRPHPPTSTALTLEWCQTKYNVAVYLGTEEGLDSLKYCLAMSEAVAGIRYMVYYQMETLPFVSQQLLKRLYWLVFAGQW